MDAFLLLLISSFAMPHLHPTRPMTMTHRFSSTTKPMPTSTRRRRCPTLCLHALAVIPTTWVIFLCSTRLLLFFNPQVPISVVSKPDSCSGKYVYIQSLPTKFNSDILSNCKTLSSWTDMCLYTSNDGLGPPLPNYGPGWFATNQFSLELIFHNRMKRYRCLTNSSAAASAVFVPFYAGLEISRHLWGYNTTVRDAAALELAAWLRSKPEWSVMNGRDHFMVAGRITWDFRRLTNVEPNWGNRLLLLPELKNMTTLVIESSPWHSNDVAVPYPTYFHPSTYTQVVKWQDRIRNLSRPYLFSFAGAPRPNATESIRGRLFEQCRTSSRCNLLECGKDAKRCHSPGNVMKVFEASVFCLQPQGDSYTRRSAFDAMLAGCIPVFFHPGSAYVQYTWHLGRDYRRYSVYIPEEDVREGRAVVEKVLEGIGEREVERMREEVVEMVPRLVYGEAEGMMDAFEVAVEGVLRRVERAREEGGEVLRYEEQNSWKYELVGSEGPHEWDRFFSTPSI